MRSLREQWSSILALCAGLLTPLLMVFPGDGQRLLMSFPVQIIGLIMLVHALVRHRNWLLLLVLPFLGYPLVLWSTFLYQCSQGNCL